MRLNRLTVLIGALTLAWAAQGLLDVSRAEQPGERKVITKGKVKIIEEKGPAGHKTIGIDESSLGQDASKELPLTFSTLMTWEYEAKRRIPPPDNVKRLDGRKIRITGFMFPLLEGSNIQSFCLLRTTQTCCYGPRPQYNQYIFVEMAKPTSFKRLDPVTCVGKLKVEPTPEEGYIYRMEGEVCEAVTEKGS